MKKLLSLLLVVFLLPIRADEPTPADPGPSQDTVALAACLVAAAGIAAGAVYIFSHKCQPKYYWLMDDSQPPNFWVATATRKQCQIEGWHRIGGPYTHPQDAPAIHPDPTNRVSLAASAPLNISVQATTDLQNWTTVYQETADTEDFSYCTTNAAMFRLMVTP